MKICQLCAVDFTLKKFLLPLVDALTKQDHSVISVCSPGIYTSELSSMGYSVKTLRISRNYNIASHFFSIINLYIFFKNERFDIVHVHSPIASIVGRIAARLAGVPIVLYTAHGFYFHEDMPLLKKKFFITIERILGRITDHIFSQSNEDASTALEEKIVPASKITVIGNGVDPSIYHPRSLEYSNQVRHELDIPDDAFVVGMVSRLVAEKGVVEFLHAAIRIFHSNKKIFFLLVGGSLSSEHDDDILPDIVDAKKILGPNLVLTGLREDVHRIFSAMNIFVLPSWREGMPRTIIEAMFSGVPIIATRIRGSRELITDGVTGRLIPVRCSKCLSDEILSFFDNRLLMEQFSGNAIEVARKFYDEAVVIDKQLSIISQIMRCKP